MLTSLLLSAFFMGLAGVPHCAAMCAAPCAAAFPGGLSWSVLVGRTVGYALLGGIAAQAANWLAAWSVWADRLQTLWIMALAGTVLLGAWMLLRGQLPAFILTQGTAMYERLRARVGHASFIAGMAWAALPCGLLYSAVVAATLAQNAWQGALVMLVFSLPGGIMLKVLPGLWQRGRSGAQSVGGSWAARLVNPQWAIRLSGGTLALAAAWALNHRLQAQWQAWCA